MKNYIQVAGSVLLLIALHTQFCSAVQNLSPTATLYGNQLQRNQDVSIKNADLSAIASITNNNNNKNVAALAKQNKENELLLQNRMDRFKRSVLVGYFCVFTWMLIKFLNLTIFQAASIQGICASLMLTPPYTAAAFCGSIAGMSGHIKSISDTTILGLLAATLYYLSESGNKIGVGYGGRLGVIAFLANVIYMAGQDLKGLMSAIENTVKTLRTETFVAIFTTWVAFKTTPHRIASKNNSKSLNETTDSSAKMIQSVAKVVLLGILLNRMVATTPTSAISFLTTATSVFGASLISKKSPGVVVPVAVLGLASSIIIPALTVPLFLGGVIGMTGIKQYNELNFLEASVFASCLHHLGIFNGYGGKLGVLAFIGVFLGL